MERNECIVNCTEKSGFVCEPATCFSAEESLIFVVVTTLLGTLAFSLSFLWWWLSAGRRRSSADAWMGGWTDAVGCACVRQSRATRWQDQVTGLAGLRAC